MARDLDPESNPAAFASAELRRARLAAGMSQDQLARKLGFDRTVITKAETGERPPSPEVATAIDETFPHSKDSSLVSRPWLGEPSAGTRAGSVSG